MQPHRPTGTIERYETQTDRCTTKSISVAVRQLFVLLGHWGGISHKQPKALYNGCSFSRIITRNRTLRTSFLLLIRDDGWKHSKEECRIQLRCEPDRCSLLTSKQNVTWRPNTIGNGHQWPDRDWLANGSTWFSCHRMAHSGISNLSGWTQNALFTPEATTRFFKHWNHSTSSHKPFGWVTTRCSTFLKYIKDAKVFSAESSELQHFHYWAPHCLPISNKVNTTAISLSTSYCHRAAPQYGQEAG